MHGAGFQHFLHRTLHPRYGVFLAGVANIMFLVLEYVDKDKRTLVGNLGLALFLTLSGVYQPWAMKYAGLA